MTGDDHAHQYASPGKSISVATIPASTQMPLPAAPLLLYTQAEPLSILWLTRNHEAAESHLAIRTETIESLTEHQTSIQDYLHLATRCTKTIEDTPTTASQCLLLANHVMVTILRLCLELHLLAQVHSVHLAYR